MDNTDIIRQSLEAGRGLLTALRYGAATPAWQFSKQANHIYLGTMLADVTILRSTDPASKEVTVYGFGDKHVLNGWGYFGEGFDLVLSTIIPYKREPLPRRRAHQAVGDMLNRAFRGNGNEVNHETTDGGVSITRSRAGNDVRISSKQEDSEAEEVLLHHGKQVDLDRKVQLVIVAPADTMVTVRDVVGSVAIEECETLNVSPYHTRIHALTVEHLDALGHVGDLRIGSVSYKTMLNLGNSTVVIGTAEGTLEVELIRGGGITIEQGPTTKADIYVEGEGTTFTHNGTVTDHASVHVDGGKVHIHRVDRGLCPPTVRNGGEAVINDATYTE